MLIQSLTNEKDIKEIVPEFFFMPETLLTSNLPKWCDSDPYKFIVKHREILESP